MATYTQYNQPVGDFVTSSLNGALTAIATTATIGGGLNIAATNGILQIDYNSIVAVGVAGGPETISYATYTTGTGALTGIVRGIADTTGVTHANGALVQAGPSIVYSNQGATAYTVTWGGFSGNPTYTAWYALLGGHFTIYTLSVSAAGTSNATNLTVSLPTVPARTVTIIGGAYQDNGSAGATGPCTVSLTAGNSTANIGISSGNTSGWTNANGKFASFNIIYENQ